MLAAARVGKLILQLRQRSLQVSRLQPSTASALGRHQLRAMSEQQKAQTAGEEEVTIFDKIVAKQIPSDILYEDDTALAFRDINAQAPVHFLVIPKHRDGLSRMTKAEDRHEKLLGHLLVVASKVARQENLTDGYRVVINDGANGCQSVYHLHLHIMGGRKLSWPPG